jgi:branched-chain amino acid transport system permease protein
MELPFGVYNTSPGQELAVVRTRMHWVLLALALAAAFLLPTVASGEWLTWLTIAGTFAVAALGLHVMIGLSGQFSMAQAALMAVGAYTAGVLAHSHGVPAWVTLPLAGLFAGILGASFAIPAVRIHGFYLVMVTMAAQFVIDWALKHISWTGGSYGLAVNRLVFFGHPVTDVQYCWIVMAVLVICIFLVKNIQRTNIGRRLVAMRDNEVAAEVMGVNLLWTKVLAFFIGSFFAGIAGWLWAYNNGILFLNPDQFDFMLSMKLLGMLVVGGLGSTSGAILGVMFLQLADKLTDNINSILGDILPGDLATNLGPSMALMIFALIVILFIMLEPHGIYGRVMRIRLWLSMHPFSF